MIGGPGRGRSRWGTGLEQFKLRRRAGLPVWGVLAVLGSVQPGSLDAQAPDEDYRTITTDHFRVTFPVELEKLGRRAADRAEFAYAALEGAFIEAPDGLIDILVTDHTDNSNGYAQVQPSNRITVFARPPADGLSLGYFDDWMELVVTHELAHIVHLDYTANPIGRLARAVFGRVQNEWPLFPSLATPRWVSEGLATWYESLLTESGRVKGTYQEMELRTAALEGRFERIDQASGDSPLWPGGNRPYTYGARFFEYLLDKHGEDRMAAFVEAVAGQWIPYRLDAAGLDAFGVSLSDEWRMWTATVYRDNADLDSRLDRFGPVTEPERLTTDARWGLHPTVAPDGSRLAYTRSDGRSDLQLRIDDPAGGAGRQLTQTNGLATYSWVGADRLLFAQLELSGPYRAYGDLYFVDLEGRERRLTHGARLGDPSVAPDGRFAVAVRHGGGTNGLVRVDLTTGDVSPLVAPEMYVHWAFPRISPNGRWIAATRWQPNAYADIVVLDASTGRELYRITEDRAIDLAPSWSADSGWLVWSSDRSGIPNIYGVRIDPDSGAPDAPVMLTNLRTGGALPSIDPTGAWLYFSGYHVDGWDVERTPFLGSTAPVAPPVDPRFALAGGGLQRGEATQPLEPYAARRTLRPTYWELSSREPIVFPARTNGDGLALRRRTALGYAVGAQTSGHDLVGRHRYSLLGRVFTEGGKVEAGFGYSNASLGNPVLSFTATQSYDDGGQLTAGTNPDTLFVLQRERELQAAATVLAPRWRHNLFFTLSGGLVWEDRELLDRRMTRTDAYQLARPESRLGELSVSTTFVSARTHSFQMGMTRGVNLFVQGRLRPELSVPDSIAGVDAADRSVGEVLGRARAAIPLWSTGRVRHVLALQASGGIASGPGAGPGQYDVGGASGRPETITGAELFGGGFRFFPVRGYVSSTRFGRYAWATSAEYRFPLGLFNRGLGAWPIHLDRAIGSVFVDAGNAWGPDVWPTGFPNPLRSAIASVGAEVTTEFLALYDIQTRVRTGVAVPLVDGSGARLYVRVGLPF